MRCRHAHCPFFQGVQAFPHSVSTKFFVGSCNSSPGTSSAEHGPCPTRALLRCSRPVPPPARQLTLKLFEAAFQHAGVLSGVDEGGWRQQEAPGALRPCPARAARGATGPLPSPAPGTRVPERLGSRQGVGSKVVNVSPSGGNGVPAVWAPELRGKSTEQTWLRARGDRPLPTNRSDGAGGGAGGGARPAVAGRALRGERGTALGHPPAPPPPPRLPQRGPPKVRRCNKAGPSWGDSGKSPSGREL